MKSKTNLSITVKGAKLLQDLDEQKGKGKQDPVAIIQLGNQKFKTKPATNQGKIPVWNEVFQFVYDPKNSSLKVSIFDIDPQRKNSEELIGDGNLHLQIAESAPEWKVSVPLYKNQNDMGSLELEFDFIGKQKPPPAKQDKSELGSERQLEKSNNQSLQSKKKQSLQKDENFEFQTVNIETQQAELRKWIQEVQEREYINTLKYIEDSRLQAAIERALDEVAEKNPEDQIDYFADCLLKFK